MDTSSQDGTYLLDDDDTPLDLNHGSNFEPRYDPIATQRNKSRTCADPCHRVDLSLRIAGGRVEQIPGEIPEERGDSASDISHNGQSSNSVPQNLDATEQLSYTSGMFNGVPPSTFLSHM
jgi:hypothetical protein